jgi:N-acetylglucosaminyldiphosphoundecaprenol N-acetyl-beta-D-mannosaminyltransferase
MKSSRVILFNIPIDALTMTETIDTVDRAIRDKTQIHHVAVNVGLVVAMQTNKELHSSVISADIVNADGLPLVWASRFFRKPLPERVAGIDLMQNLVDLAGRKGYTMFLLGAKEEVVAKLADSFSRRYSPAILAGYRNGYFDESQEPEVAKEINLSGANMLFVALPSPRKEIFLHRYKDTLRHLNFIMCVGGSFDVIAGKVKRAPRWMQKTGLEWLHRVMQEPGRMWKRYLVTNTLFIYYFAKEFVSPRKYY